VKYLRQSTGTTVVIGPFLAKGDGFTPLASLSAPAGRVVKNGTGAALTVASWAHDANGHYTIDLAAGDTNTIGRLRLDFSDPTTFLPVWEDFSVLSAAVYDVLFGTVAPSTYAGGDTAGVATLLAGVNLTAVNGMAVRPAGTAQGGGSATITLDAADPDAAGDVTGRTITLVGGTGIGQARRVVAYNAATRVATVDTSWATVPDNTSKYMLADYAPAGGGSGSDTPGTTTLLGRLTATRADNLDFLDAPVLSRMASFSYTAPDNAGIVAIRARTDNLPADPASDTQVNTRLATAGYTAPANATIAAIAADYQQRAVAVTLPTTPPAGYGGGGGGASGPVDLTTGALAAVAGSILVTAANRLRSDAQGRVELAPGGLEQVPVGDAGGNARHALDAIYSAQAHAVQASPASGPGHVTIGPPGDPRIEADVDGLGNRSNVTVTRRELP
jgi:hypothetical protein